MNVIAAYVVAKENLNRKIADKTAELYLTGMSYKDALKEAKKIYGYYDEKDAWTKLVFSRGGELLIWDISFSPRAGEFSYEVLVFPHILDNFFIWCFSLLAYLRNSHIHCLSLLKDEKTFIIIYVL